jgi:hypothetical protein
MTVSMARRISRLFSDVSRMKSDSGVVTRMCGGRCSMARRAGMSVSPVRTAVRISGMFTPRSAARARISASGPSRFFWMSLPSALSGEMYSTSVRSVSVPSSA